jgi:cyclophilin family peptidyl-prolyl cis-trans isomerase
MQLGPDRVEMEVEGYGAIILGFYPNAAPVTVAHILKLFRLGCYDTNHIFRVDKGFVAQVQSVHSSSVQQPLSAECVAESDKNVPGEFTNIRHVRGTLSMGRLNDPDSGGSSFSMLLGRAAHLDHQCASAQLRVQRTA